MTKPKVEVKNAEQLASEALENLQKIVQFLEQSSDYQDQITLINNLKSMLNGKNTPSREGKSVEKRTLASLKIAIAFTKNLALTPEEKGKLIEDCMRVCYNKLFQIPADIFRTSEHNVKGSIPPFLKVTERVNLGKTSSFFKDAYTAEDELLVQEKMAQLFSALFMGNEAIAVEIVENFPDLMFQKGYYQLPLHDVNNNKLPQSEQIYPDITPLELMFYTGDWKMWKRILPLIPKEYDEKVFQTMQAMQGGGPDLVKVDKDPMTMTSQELKHCPAKDDKGFLRVDAANQPIYDNLLQNRNGIVCYEKDNQIQLFYVDIDPITKAQDGQMQDAISAQVHANVH